MNRRSERTKCASMQIPDGHKRNNSRKNCLRISDGSAAGSSHPNKTRAVSKKSLPVSGREETGSEKL